MAHEDKIYTQNILSAVSKMEERMENYRKKIVELEGIIDSKNILINKLKSNLNSESFKITILSNLLSLHTQINPEEIFKTSKDGLHVYNYENGNIPVLVHDYFNPEKVENHTITCKKVIQKSGKVFRTAKNKVELVSEKPLEQEEKVKKVEEKLEELAKEFEFDVSFKETIRVMDGLFDELVKSRVYKKILSSIMQNRLRLMGKIKLPEYIKLVKTHIKRLEDYFSKKNDAKKVPSLVSTGLSPLEQRLVFYGQYYNSYLEADEIQKMKASLKINMDYARRYVPFSYEELYTGFYDYSVAICSLKENIKRIIVNPYGFSNVVYLDLEKGKEDPYSFYILERIEDDGKRYWKIEYRLDNFSKSLAQYLRNYCTELFRKIYLTVFNDNIYRENYREQSAITQDDCDQLIISIIALSKSKSFCNMVKDIVMKHNIIRPSEIDRFDFTADDRMNKRQFASEADSREDMVSSIRSLFDDISDQDIETILRSLE